MDLPLLTQGMTIMSDTPSTITGSCHCGRVNVTIPADAIGVVACHCGDCQKLHGNFFAMLATSQDAVTWSGQEHIRWYESSPQAKRAFCDHCGSRLAKAPQGSPRQLISIGLFERALERQIIKNVFADSKPHWYSLPQEVQS